MKQFQEIEKKFLVKQDALPDLAKRKRTQIEQFYIPIELFSVGESITCNGLPVAHLQIADEKKALLKVFKSLTEARVRITEDGAKLTFKSQVKDSTRKEFEWKVEDAKYLSRLILNASKCLRKERYILLTSDGYVFEVDKFCDHEFMLAELEVDSKKELEDLVLPEWIGQDVTDNENYYNEKLAKLL